MRKLMLTFGCAVLVMALGTTGASAQVCVTFEVFCDALELNLAEEGVFGQPLTGTWLNLDCLGAEAPVAGRAGSQKAEVVCDDDSTCPLGADFDFTFRFDGNTKTYDLIGFAATGFSRVFQTDVPYRATPGACSLEDRSRGGESLVGYRADD